MTKLDGETVDSSKLISQERHHDAAILFGSGRIVSKWLDPLMTCFTGRRRFQPAPWRRTAKIVIQPDCGLKYLPRDVASKKMRPMVEGALVS